MTQALLICGLIGPPLFVIVFLLEGLLRPQYRPWNHYVSLLSLGKRGWIQVLNFVLFGSLLFGFAFGLRDILQSGPGSVMIPALLGTIGLALIASGIFKSDPALGYPAGTPNTWPPPPLTLPGKLHGLGGVLVFGLLPITIFITAWRFETEGQVAWMVYSILSGIMFSIFFIISGALSQGVRPHAPIGLFQRLSIITGWTWIAFLALHFVQGHP